MFRFDARKKVYVKRKKSITNRYSTPAQHERSCSSSKEGIIQALAEPNEVKFHRNIFRGMRIRAKRERVSRTSLLLRSYWGRTRIRNRSDQLRMLCIKTKVHT